MGSVVPFSRQTERAEPQQTTAQPIRLTKRVVDSLRPHPSKEVFAWDDQLGGFGVRVQPTGMRTYLLQYRDASRRTRRVSLGRHGVITTDEARRQAVQLLAAVGRGENPSVERREARRRAQTASPPKTVGDIVERYLDFTAQRRKPSTVKGYRASAPLIRDPLGAIAASELTTAEVRAWHTALASTPTRANRALALLSAAFSYAGLENPCRTKMVERYREKERNRFYTPAELGRIGTVLAEGERTRTIADGVVTAIRLLALTGCRMSEILTLEWAHVDLDAGVLRLPDAKAGARLVPLSTAACALLASLPREGRFVAAGRKPDTPVNPWTLEGNWARIRKAASLENARLHDLRHTVGTSAGSAGLNAFSVRDILGHKTLAMTSRYVSQDTAPLRRAADIAVGPIADALFGRSSNAASDADPPSDR